MTYDLYLGDYTYSSWSLRAWLLFDRFGIPASRHMVWFGGERSVADQLRALGLGTRTVPTLRTPDGAVIGDSLAIAEELAARHPDAGFWPEDSKARAFARAAAAEMHASFAALRATCPMDLRRAYAGFRAPDDVRADIDRIEAVWASVRQETGAKGPWLCGDYSTADAFYAPVAARIATYGIEVSEESQAYVRAHLADLSFRRWRAMGLVRGEDLPWYAQAYEPVAWPGPTLEPACAAEAGPAENENCPYSGRPVTHFLTHDGRTWGFCNAFCRDKTAADPVAWPAFTALTEGRA